MPVLVPKIDEYLVHQDNIIEFETAKQRSNTDLTKKNMDVEFTDGKKSVNRSIGKQLFALSLVIAVTVAEYLRKKRDEEEKKRKKRRSMTCVVVCLDIVQNVLAENEIEDYMHQGGLPTNDRAKRYTRKFRSRA